MIPIESRLSKIEHVKGTNYLKNGYVPEPVCQNGEIILRPTRFYINQCTEFEEFDLEEVRKKTGLDARQMRIDGCGIAALHMILATVKGGEYLIKFATVGELAQIALSIHKKSFIYNGKLYTPCPVYDREKGWYHNGLLRLGELLINIEAYRRENLTIEQLAAECELLNSHNSVMTIASIRNIFWRTYDEPQSNSTHLLVVNGFRIENGQVLEIRVSDPFSPKQQEKNNIWRQINERTRQAFRGKALFFTS